MSYSRWHIAAIQKVNDFARYPLVSKSEIYFGTNVLCSVERVLFKRFFKIFKSLHGVMEVRKNLEKLRTVESVEKHGELAERYRAFVKMFGLFNHVVTLRAFDENINPVIFVFRRFKIRFAVRRVNER